VPSILYSSIHCLLSSLQLSAVEVGNLLFIGWLIMGNWVPDIIQLVILILIYMFIFIADIIFILSKFAILFLHLVFISA
jgi:hypothetical protein